MRYVMSQKNILLTTVLFIFGVFAFLGSVDAANWSIGDDTEFYCDVTITYGAGWRTSDQEDELLADINSDDGNRNYEQWDMFNNKVVAFADIDLSHKNFGVFVRPKVLYDHVYMTDNANDSPETNNALFGGLTDSSDEWAEEVEDVHGFNTKVLDAFAYTNFWLGSVPVDIRVGRQVISWGTSKLIGGISAVQSPIDVSVARAVATETKERYLPTGAAYVQTGYNDFGISFYYQFEWEKNLLYEGGTYFSTTDYVDEIKAPRLSNRGGTMSGIPRGDDQEAKDDGQYGISLSYILPWKSTEIAAYYINYHAKDFILEFTPTYSNYYLTFTEDIKAYGLAIDTNIADYGIGIEFHYRDDIRFQNAEIGIGTGQYWQVQANFTHLFNQNFIWDNCVLLGEVAYARQEGLEHNEEAFQYSAYCILSWYQVFTRTDLGMTFKINDTPKGSIAATGFREDFTSAGVGVNATYNERWKFDLSYQNNWQDNTLRDRDTLALKVSYSF